MAGTVCGAGNLTQNCPNANHWPLVEGFDIMLELVRMSLIVVDVKTRHNMQDAQTYEGAVLHVTPS
jgi:hypothetical protein